MIINNKTNNCIFGTDVTKCSSYSAESFKYIICTKHLEEIYGLEVVPFHKSNETYRQTIGPFLQPAYKTSFKPNTVIIPDQTFFDKSFDTLEKVADDYKYTINNALLMHIQNLVSESKHSSDPNSMRLHYHLIRHMSEPDPTQIKDIKVNNSDLLKTLKDRLHRLRNIVDDPVYKKIYENIDLLENGVITEQKDIAEGNETKVAAFSAFYQFFMTNILHSFHETRATDPIMYAATIPANMTYKKGIGFVALMEISNGDYLVSLSQETGTSHLYKSKVYEEQFPTRDISHKTKMADGNHIHHTVFSNCNY